MKNNFFIYDNKVSKLKNYLDITNGKVSDGIFSLSKKISKNKHFLARDDYGCKKLFYIIKQNNLYSADNFIDLRRKTNSTKILSVPVGSYIIYDKKINKKKISKIKFKKKFHKLTQVNIKKRLSLFFKSINTEYGDTCIILLSGGLDSTIIAYLAKKKFKNVIAVTCLFLNNKDFEKYQKYNHLKIENYSDLKTAKKISKKLKIKFDPLILKLDEIKKNLFKTMHYIQDWRDFNLHCGCLNFQLAKYIKSKYGTKIPIFSGDFMNELFADYNSEYIDGKEYYKQLKVSNYLRSKWFTQGLETSDRENGIFSKFGLIFFQPYFIIIDMFRNMEKDFLIKNNKHDFNKKIIPKSLYRILPKNKIRAQITDKEGGILKYFIDKKLNEKKIIKLFSKKFKFSRGWLNRFIIFGRYRIEELK